MKFSRQEVLIASIHEFLKKSKTIAVGVLSPIPGAAALLAKELSPDKKVFILGSNHIEHKLTHGVEIFNLAGQGRLDTFFLSGGQIDGKGNINLNGKGTELNPTSRWSGAFGSAYLYFTVPNVILFKEKHTTEGLVDAVDFISSPGTSRKETFRIGGPTFLVTSLCNFKFNKRKQKFELISLHKGVSLEEVLDNTGFEFDYDRNNIKIFSPHPKLLKLIRTKVKKRLFQIYPEFAQKFDSI